MSCDVEVLDQVASGYSAEAIAGLVQAVLNDEGREGALSVVLVDEAAMARLNADFRGQTGSTDVLSFPETDAASVLSEPVHPASFIRWCEPDSCLELGEMVLCPAVVTRYAQEDGVPLVRQLGWTLIHGALHLLGYDHERDQGQMRVRESELLERHASLLSALLTP